MKVKTLLFFGTIALLSDRGYSALFGIDSTLFKKQTTEIKTELSAIKSAQLTANTDIAGIKSSIGELSVKIGNINTELSAKMTAVDKSINSSISSGRDTNTTNTNDSELMKFIFDKIIYVIGLILGLVGTLIASYERLLKQKDKWIADVEKRNSEKQEKLDDWQNKLIEKIIDKGDKNVL